MEKVSSSPAWAACIAADLAAALDGIRLVPGLESCVCGSDLWVRGGGAHGSSLSSVIAVPWYHRYEVRDEGFLFEHGKVLPSGRLPSGPWQPLTEMMAVVAPSAKLPGKLRGRALLEMQRSDQEQQISLVALPVQVWHDYAVAASEIRLSRWQFVLNEERGLALVRGSPLPPLPGARFWVHEQLAFPAGFEPTPKVSAQAMVRLLKLAPNELALFDEDGTFARVPGNHWRPADRSVVRMNCGPRG